MVEKKTTLNNNTAAFSSFGKFSTSTRATMSCLSLFHPLDPDPRPKGSVSILHGLVIAWYLGDCVMTQIQGP